MENDDLKEKKINEIKDALKNTCKVAIYISDYYGDKSDSKVSVNFSGGLVIFNFNNILVSAWGAYNQENKVWFIEPNLKSTSVEEALELLIKDRFSLPAEITPSYDDVKVEQINQYFNIDY